MQIVWTGAGQQDLRRIYDFLSPHNQLAAERAIEALTGAPDLLLSQPRLGAQIASIRWGEVRRLLVGQYEVRYMQIDDEIRILRVFHTREDR